MQNFSFRPLTGISLFLYRLTKQLNKSLLVFVPSRGFLFFYKDARIAILNLVKFSSPHGDFSFSIVLQDSRTQFNNWFSSPHGDFSFSISDTVFGASPRTQVFVPSRGFLFFYDYEAVLYAQEQISFRPLTGISLFLYGNGST